MSAKNISFSKVWLILFSLIFMVSLASCSTLKGVGRGIVETCRGTKEGFKEDWQVLKNWDNKFRENFW